MEDKNRSIQLNLILKDQNNKILSRIEELEKYGSNDNTQIKEEVYYLQKKLADLEENLKDNKAQNVLMLRSIQFLKIASETGNSIKDLVTFAGSKDEFYKLCNYIMVNNLIRREELRTDNADLLEKYIVLGEEFSKSNN